MARRGVDRPMSFLRRTLRRELFFAVVFFLLTVRFFAVAFRATRFLEVAFFAVPFFFEAALRVVFLGAALRVAFFFAVRMAWEAHDAATFRRRVRAARERSGAAAPARGDLSARSAAMRREGESVRMRRGG